MEILAQVSATIYTQASPGYYLHALWAGSNPLKAAKEIYGKNIEYLPSH